MAALLSLQDIQCQYQDQIVINHLNLQLHAGEIGCLLGPSGCGKTTLLRAIAGFENIVKGSITLDDMVLSSPNNMVPTNKRHIGMVFQDYALFPHLSVAENIRFGVNQLPEAEQRQIVERLLELIHLTNIDKRYPHELSGGQQQRVALARALAPRPKLILLDEPFSNLDTSLRQSLSAEVRTILKAQGTSAIIVTHDQQEAFTVADTIGVVNHGKLEQWGTANELFYNPATQFVANFISQGCFITGQVVTEQRILSDLGEFSSPGYSWPSNTPVNIFIRPSDILNCENSKVVASVVQKTFLGASTLYKLRLNSGARISALWPSHQVFDIGELIPIKLDNHSPVAFPQS